MAAPTAAVAAAAAVAKAAAAAAAKPRLMVVLGTTGVGKTRLGVELARRLNGEVVNADVMQMYRGLDIATAKVTAEETQGVPHHLMSFLEPTEPFTPHRYREVARKAIHDITARNKLPILVGGTLYYVQSLLWDSLIEHDDNPHGSGATAPTASTADLWSQLQRVDPEMAAQLHPHNVRKIERSLQIFRTTGKRHSELIAEQHARGGGVGSSASMLYNCCFVWLRADREVLRARLDARVDKMMDAGLINELRTLRAELTAGGNRADLDTTRGILQSIGFKEYFDYFKALDTVGHGSDANGSVEPIDQTGLQTLLDESTERLKTSTKRYARKQLAWIRNRLVKRDIVVHMLDATDLAAWETTALEPAVDLGRALLDPDHTVSNPIALHAWTHAQEFTSAHAQKQLRAERRRRGRKRSRHADVLQQQRREQQQQQQIMVEQCDELVDPTSKSESKG